MKVDTTISVNVSIDKAWDIFVNDFNNAHVWMAQVFDSYERPNGGGRVCELSTDPNGLTADETINNVDEANHSFTFTVVPQGSSVLPVKNNKNTITMVRTGDNSVDVTWSAEPDLKTAGKVLSPVLKAGFSKGFGKVLEEFKHYAETGQPHPRKVSKVKANAKKAK